MKTLMASKTKLQTCMAQLFGLFTTFPENKLTAKTHLPDRVSLNGLILNIKQSNTIRTSYNSFAIF